MSQVAVKAIDFPRNFPQIEKEEFLRVSRHQLPFTKFA